MPKITDMPPMKHILVIITKTYGIYAQDNGYAPPMKHILVIIAKTYGIYA